MSKISGPLLDRIDLQIEVQPVDFDQMSSKAPGEPSAAIRQRVIAARMLQERRFKDEPGIHCNAQMTPSLLHKYAEPNAAGLEKLKDAMERMNMSARAYDRILKVARTIADLEGTADVLDHHIMEAIAYRNLDRPTYLLYWHLSCYPIDSLVLKIKEMYKCYCNAHFGEPVKIEF